MIQGTRLSLLIVLAAVLITGTLFWWTGRACPDTAMVSITTDRQVYSAGETVSVIIRNTGDRPVDIYCPSWCALGNFPTTVDRFVDGRWEYFAGFCPSIGSSPLEQRGTVEGEYIMHSLESGGTFQIGLANFEALHIGKEEQLRVVYYLCRGRVPVYSRNFTISP